jgi:hypothetical protein
MNSDYCIKLAHKVGVPIQKLSAETMTQLISAPQAQLRTAIFKKAVYIVEDLVFKGPYTCDDQGLMKNLRYTYAIEFLEAALQLPEWQRGSLRWEYLGCWDDKRYYLVAPNVGKWKNIPRQRMNSKLEKNVVVVPRGEAVDRVSDIEKTGLSADIKSATLQHLYLRFLLDIGDSGTYNVLIREDNDSTERLIAGIDLEDRRGNGKKKRRLDLLFSKPYKKHIALYRSDISKIKSLSYSQLDQHTLDRLNAVGIDLERLKKNMDLWVKTPI